MKSNNLIFSSNDYQETSNYLDRGERILGAILQVSVDVELCDNRNDEGVGRVHCSDGEDDYLLFDIEENTVLLLLYDKDEHRRSDLELVADLARAMRLVWQREHGMELGSSVRPRDKKEYFSSPSWADADAFSFVFMSCVPARNVDHLEWFYDAAVRDCGLRRAHKETLETTWHCGQ